jgi:DNA-binding CsgD family transcriptional regulator
VHKQVDDGLQVLDQALQESDRLLAPDIAYWTALGLSSSGRFEEAVGLYEAGLSRALATGNKTYTALLAGGLTFSAVMRLDVHEAALNVALLREIKPPYDMVATVRIHFARAVLAGYRGDWRETAAIAEEWVREVRLAGLFQQAGAKLVLAEAQSILGEHESALANLDFAADNIERERSLALVHKARALVRAERPEEALAIVEDLGPHIAASSRASATRLLLADVVADIGPRNLATQLLRSLQEEQRGMLMVYIPLSTRRVVGKLQAFLGQLDAAFRSFEQAVEELSIGGARYELARALAEYGSWRMRRNRRGDAVRGAAFVSQADEIFQDLGLPSRDRLFEADLRPARFGLSAREKEVLSLMAQGLPNREIADALGITHFTVARHIERILSKTQATNRTEAARIANESQLFAP